MKRLACLYLFTFIFQYAVASNILVLAPVCGRSNRMTYLPLLEELGRRGHNVTVLSPHKSSKPMENVQEIVTIPWKEIEKTMAEKLKFDPFKSKEEGKEALSVFTVMNTFDYFCREALDLPIIAEILKEKFDLIIMQAIFNNCALGMVYRLQTPFILLSPVAVVHPQVDMMGGHLPPSFNPLQFMNIPNDMNFFWRMANFGGHLAFSLMQKYYTDAKSTAIYREKLGEDIPPCAEILANASLFISNSHFSLSQPIPLLPDIIETGGLHSFRKPKPLPKDIDDFIRKGKDGFIYFSMGSNIRETDMPEEKRKVFLNAFSKLKQQVLWKWGSETMPDLPKNVKLSKWLPQQDLLAHKDIKMFITHCGGGSTEESIYSGVPIVGFPMFADQPMNAKLAHSLGMIVELEWKDVTEKDLLNGINEILNNPKFRDNAKKVSNFYSDRPISPLDNAVYWVEYVIRHDGAPHLRSAGRKLNWFQYHSYDVILTYLALLGVIIYLIFATLRCLIRKICFKKTGDSGTGSMVSSAKKRQKRD